MHLTPEIIGPIYLALACGIALISGLVKGAVGFGMPMIMISGMGSFLSPELALAALILPTVTSNVWQALRGGWSAALFAVTSHWVFICSMLVLIVISANLVNVFSPTTLFLILGTMVSVFAVSQLADLRFEFSGRKQRPIEIIFGATAGFFGGLSGVWGPPTVAYLMALNIDKDENVRIQGVVYAAGSVVLLFSHMKTGVLNAANLPLAIWMIAPAMIGMALGVLVQNRLDQDRFRRATLLVLVFAGANLIRRGLMG